MICSLAMCCVGTFAVVELMIGNSVERVITGNPGLAENCLVNGSLADTNDTIEFLLDGELTTCRDVKQDIIVTLALLSGVVMVSEASSV